MAQRVVSIVLFTSHGVIPVVVAHACFTFALESGAGGVIGAVGEEHAQFPANFEIAEAQSWMEREGAQLRSRVWAVPAIEACHFLSSRVFFEFANGRELLHWLLSRDVCLGALCFSRVGAA